MPAKTEDVLCLPNAFKKTGRKMRRMVNVLPFHLDRHINSRALFTMCYRNVSWYLGFIVPQLRRESSTRSNDKADTVSHKVCIKKKIKPF